MEGSQLRFREEEEEEEEGRSPGDRGWQVEGRREVGAEGEGHLFVVSFCLNNIYLTDSCDLTGAQRGCSDTTLVSPRCRGDNHLAL